MCNKQYFKKQHKQAEQKGFTLLEIVIALSVMGLLTVFLANSIKTVTNHDDYQANKSFMSEVKLALLTFVQVNGYMPCPDTDGDGRENRAAPLCAANVGTLPYQDIGVKAVDKWNNSLYYAVHSDASDAAQVANTASAASYFNSTTARFFTLATAPVGDNPAVTGFIKICSGLSNNCNGATVDADRLELAAVAMVMSFGENGAQTWSAMSPPANINLLSPREQVNADEDADKYYWQSVGSNVQGQTFDDQIVWLTGYDIKYATIRSGNAIAW